MVIQINKDIDRYQESVAMGLSPKQLAFSVSSVVVGGGIVLGLYPVVGLTLAVYVAVPCVVPIALGGFYSFNEMDFYEFMSLKLKFAFCNKPLVYESTEGEAAIKDYKQELATAENRKGGTKCGLFEQFIHRWLQGTKEG